MDKRSVKKGEKKAARLSMKKSLKARARAAVGSSAAPPPPKRVDPYTGNLYVLDEVTKAWTLVDTLDPGLHREQKGLVTLAREGCWIPPVNVGAHDIGVLKAQLPPGIGVGRYYFIVQSAKIRAWMECTEIVLQVVAN